MDFLLKGPSIFEYSMAGDASAEGTTPIRFIQFDKTPCG